MAFFIPQYIQKRLLRYALSRLELLDTNALDLERLDISLGKRSTVELRDVGLDLKKLTTLLHLPAELRITAARILLLRVTVPADIYATGILAEVDGVDVQARAYDTTNNDKRRAPDPAPSRWSPQSPRPGRRRHRRPSVSFEERNEEDGALPTTEDLAKSFLAEEPAEEREELEAALTDARSQVLSESTHSSTSGEEEFLGTGTGLTLPTFLANFLQGVADRLQVTIKNISLRLDVNLPANDSFVARNPDSAALGLHISSVGLQGLTPNLPKQSVPGSNEGDDSNRAGKRRVLLEDIRACLISQASIFANSSHPSATTSPVDVRSEASSSDNGKAFEPEAPRVTGNAQPFSPPLDTSSAASHASSQELESGPNVLESPSLSQPEFAPHHLDASVATVATNDSDRFADPDDSDSGSARIRTESDSPVVPLRHSESSFNGSIPSNLFNITDPALGHPRSLSMQQSYNSSNDQLAASADSQQVRETTFVDQSLTRELGGLPTGDASMILERPPSVDEDDSPPASPETEDLSKSRLFSHEEAESMYMSAMSGAPADSHHHVPGGWASTDSSSGGSLRDEVTGHAIPARVMGRPAPSFNDDGGCDTPRPGSRIGSPPGPNIASPPEQRGESNQSGIQDEQPDVTLTLETRPSPTGSRPDELAKEIFTVDHVTVWLPQTQQSVATPDAAAGSPEMGPVGDSSFSIRSEYQGIPGSFSHYAENIPARKTAAPAAPALPRAARFADSPPQATKVLPQAPAKDHDGGIEVILGSVDARFDVSVGKIVFQMVQALLGLLSKSASQSRPETATADRSDKTGFLGRLRVENFAASWVESLPTASQNNWPQSSNTQGPGRILLKALFAGIHTSTKTASQTTNVEANIATFSFGFVDQNVISCNEDARMRTSVRDLRSPQDKDVSFTFKQSSSATEISIRTLPVQIQFDIQKLDETLSSFGGLSGVLELSSSISSASTGLASPPRRSAPPRPRGVHFEPSVAETSHSRHQTKVNCRLAGLRVLFQGKSAGVQLSCSAVKLISRPKGISLAIDKTELSGPHLNTRNVRPITVDLGRTAVDFLYFPDEGDLDRLLSIITPSKDKYVNDDDILIDTLLRQRRKGSVIRATVTSASVKVPDVDTINSLREFGDEISKLSTVTKYLPEDDRPGILTLAQVEDGVMEVQVNDRIGNLRVNYQKAQVAHIGLPSLVAFEISKVSATRNDSEQLLGEVLELSPEDHLPMLMARMVGDEMEPTVKVKFFNVCTEYRIPTIMALMGLDPHADPDNIAPALASSVATITAAIAPEPLTRQSSSSNDSSRSSSRNLQVDIQVRDSAIGLNPQKLSSKVLFLLTDARLSSKIPSDEDITVAIDISRASVLVVDDVALIATSAEARSRPRSSSLGSRHVMDLSQLGYIPVGEISAAKVAIGILADQEGSKLLEVDFNKALFVLESCADSFQTLIATLGALQPPTPPSRDLKYRTQVMPIEDMMASFTGDAYAKPEIEELDPSEDSTISDFDEENLDAEFDMVGSFYVPEGDPELDFPPPASPVSRHHSQYSTITVRRSRREIRSSKIGAEKSAAEQRALDSSGKRVANRDYLGSGALSYGAPRTWDSTNNQYLSLSEDVVQSSPVKVRVRDVHFIWNLFDGYDWSKTRDTLTKAVRDVEAKAEERRRLAPPEEEDESVVGDFLFNSIWIEVPANKDPRELARQINRDVADNTSETESYATTVHSRTPSRSSTPRQKKARLKLERSKHPKISFELKGISADVFALPPGTGETIGSIDVRISDLEIFDRIPSSTWKKFLTRMLIDDEINRPMVHLNILNVKPVPDLAASEMVVKVNVIPLRLYVDQDALDFITRFFMFKDDPVPSSSNRADQPFLQRVEVDTVHLLLDYKPKKVDYAGLRSGHTTEFMNFIILDEAAITLRHLITYGILGFDKLEKVLNDAWMADVKAHQLPTILGGLAPVRPIVNVGRGFRDLVVIPMREYEKDGRIFRSIQKGAVAFARNTVSEGARLGAKAFIGTQNLLQNAEGLLSPQASSSPRHAGHDYLDADWDDADISRSSSPSAREERAVSNYADQPMSIMAGLRVAGRSLERDLLTARDAIIALPAEVKESGSAAGAAIAVARRAPTIILRPGIGTGKAAGMALLGLGNALDKDSRRKVEDKYKRY